MNIMPQAMQPIVRGVNEHCVRGRGRVSPHVSVLKGELLEVGVDYACMGLEGSQVTILVCRCKRTGCQAATPVPEKGMNFSLLDGCAVWDGNDCC